MSFLTQHWVKNDTSAESYRASQGPSPGSDVKPVSFTAVNAIITGIVDTDPLSQMMDNTMQNIIQIKALTKSYKSGFKALDGLDLSIREGEIFALLGPNGAGKTTLISIICGIINSTTGTVTVNGLDNRKSYRGARQLIGLVPQELSLSMFESVWATLQFTRGLYGKKPNNAYLEKILNDLSLWDKKDSKIITLSGGMKRRVLIAKALAHEPQVLFLDEPTAGVDVELRQDMWSMIHRLREQGTTIILTTHYIDEAEEMADRIGVINKGKLIIVDDKAALMNKLGKKQLNLELNTALPALPESLTGFPVELHAEGRRLTYTFKPDDDNLEIPALMKAITDEGIAFHDIQTTESSLEEIFVNLVGGEK